MFCSWGADAIPQTADVAGGVFRDADRARLHVGSCIVHTGEGFFDRITDAEHPDAAHPHDDGSAAMSLTSASRSMLSPMAR